MARQLTAARATTLKRRRPDGCSRCGRLPLRTHPSDEGPMTTLRSVLQSYVSNGSVPGAVALVARGDQVEVQAVGFADVDRTSPMARDSIFRVASITKPITAAAVLMLVEDGQIALDDPVRHWLPELASPVCRRARRQLAGDVVPAVRPVTVADLLTFRAGYGFPSDFSLPVVGLLCQRTETRTAAAAARRAARRMDGGAVPDSAAAPAGPGLAVQHLLGRSWRADRPGLRPPVARVPG